MKRASVAYVILAMSSASYGIYASPYYQSLGIPVGAIGLLLAMTSGVSLICAPLWGTLNDRLPGSRLLLPAAAGFAALGAFGISSVGASWLRTQGFADVSDVLGGYNAIATVSV